MCKTIISMENICKTYNRGKPNETKVLNRVNFNMNKGDFSSIVGESGSGKSTLMNIIGILDKSDCGRYILDDTDIMQEKDSSLSYIRNKKIGFVFQNFNLISDMTAEKNIELPMKYAGMSRKERMHRTEKLLRMVNMLERKNHYPNELSGGQKQRIAIARAMANNPSIILADEPTGALDSKTGRMVMDIFHNLNHEQNKTILLITHNMDLAKETKHIFVMKDGTLNEV